MLSFCIRRWKRNGWFFCCLSFELVLCCCALFFSQTLLLNVSNHFVVYFMRNWSRWTYKRLNIIAYLQRKLFSISTSTMYQYSKPNFLDVLGITILLFTLVVRVKSKHSECIKGSRERKKIQISKQCTIYAEGIDVCIRIRIRAIGQSKGCSKHTKTKAHTHTK